MSGLGASFYNSTDDKSLYDISEGALGDIATQIQMRELTEENMQKITKILEDEYPE